MRTTVLPFLLAGAGSALAALEVDFESTSSIKAAAKDVAFDLMSYYKGNQSGEIPGLFPMPDGKYDWWANALVWSTMIDYWRYTGDDTYNNVTIEGLMFQRGPSLEQPFLPANYSVFTLNEHQALWGIAAMQAAEAGFPSTPDGAPSWIELAKAVFDSQAARYSAEEACGGGLRMSISTQSALWNSKDTASTAIFLNLGARLYRFTGNETYGEWVERGWNWLTAIGLVDQQMNVWDVSHDGAGSKWNCSESTIIKLRLSNPASLLLQAAAYMTTQTPKSVDTANWQARLHALTGSTLTHFFPTTNTSSPNTLVEPYCERYPESVCHGRPEHFYKGMAMRYVTGAAALVPDFRGPEHAVARALRATAEGAAGACNGGGGPGGQEGRECGFRWTGGEAAREDRTKGGVVRELNALAAVMAPLVDGAAELLRDGEGGDGGEDGGEDGNGGGGGQGGEGGDGGDGNGDGTEGGDGNGENAGASTKATMGLVLAGLAAALL
ncbi:glycosyl hydrolase family 76-domain-containing protein [Chaetomium fimeti]|uniref:Mannan endo-1,6-alpha-mannosidase n=1 Tax=Chaetomium fimeti TaxID=1854472 RepID=A0AAE0LRQ4_9PEZI|nr:glycosyl hydrolase family 76-domain-containing protein [Chaetomium fimeti]